MNPKNPAIRDVVARTIIIAHKEDTNPLETALAKEGLHSTIQRKQYSSAELKYSATIRCLLNHAEAWRIAADNPGYTLIIEADFVPCMSFGGLKIPFDPKIYGDKAWAFLYSGGARIFKIMPDGSTPGQSATTVAYLISSHIGKLLLEYAAEELIRQGDLTKYSLWDSQFQWHIMGKGGICFMPYRCLGEHGGMVNIEHNKAGTGTSIHFFIARLFRVDMNHHAECLIDNIVFLPIYAKGSIWRYRRSRLIARLIGFYRAFSGQSSMLCDPKTIKNRIYIYLFSLKRVAKLY